MPTHLIYWWEATSICGLKETDLVKPIYIAPRTSKLYRLARGYGVELCKSCRILHSIRF